MRYTLIHALSFDCHYHTHDELNNKDNYKIFYTSQEKSIGICNVIALVSTTEILIQN